VGELICRSPSLMLGYHKDPERTEAAIQDGWLHTGDIVRIDKDGNLFFLDRTTDVIKSGGLNISSLEVESVLLAHPGILEAAVVGLRDDYWSEAVTAFVVPRPGFEPDPEDVRSFCRVRLAHYKVPKRVVSVGALPRDPQGKVLKRQLRAERALTT
jgi:acyl-CoA synthetase (AMP-forming)/AMP-acid ligase II